MDCVQRFLNEKGHQISQELVSRLGFSTAQARSFVHAAARRVLAAFQGGRLEITALMGGRDLSSLLSRIDREALAKEVGIQAQQADQGLAALVPILLRSIRAGGGALANGVYS